MYKIINTYTGGMVGVVGNGVTGDWDGKKVGHC